MTPQVTSEKKGYFLAFFLAVFFVFFAAFFAFFAVFFLAIGIVCVTSLRP
jgi:hypothetical protein